MQSQHQLCQIRFGVDEFKALLITLEERRENSGLLSLIPRVQARDRSHFWLKTLVLIYFSSCK